MTGLTESERKALADAASSARWPDGGYEGMPTRRTGLMVVDAMEATVERIIEARVAAALEWLMTEEQWVPISESGDRWKGRSEQEAQQAMADYPAGSKFEDGADVDGITHIEREVRYTSEWTVVPVTPGDAARIARQEPQNGASDGLGGGK